MSLRTVLMTCDAVGGVWTYALHLARGIAEQGVRVVLAALGPPPNTEQRREAERISGLDLRVFEGRLEWMDDPWDDVGRSGEWLLALERETRPDIVHSNMYAHGALPFRAPTVVVAHSCVLSWWDAVKNEPPPEKYARYRTAVARGLSGADAVVAPTRAMLEAVRKHYGSPARARVIHNATPVPSRTGSTKSQVIFSQGRLWDEAKNVEALAAIAPRTPWPIHVAGSPVHPDGRSRELAGICNLGWLGREALEACLATSAIYAHPARYEPFGLAPLEAAHAACALVLGDIPSLREIWGPNALYVASDDHEALATTLLGLIADPGRRVEMGQRAQRRARDFSLACQARDYLALYSELQEEA
ncbi:glycosyltransferase family 4 protein [Pendulispora brunnea]|uniref:Glycosyltransferase family 4 protein n=1 Tax=Pendulispora brunnea TaxID=2905690 RepID=A0ABZ2K9E1_9BACT